MLTLQFIPYNEIKSLESEQKIKRILRYVKDNKIVLMQGKLEPHEETSLIEKTMVDISNGFKGIELCTIYPDKNNINFFEKLRMNVANILVGSRDGLTVVGPSSIVKEIRRNPNVIQLFTKNIKTKRNRK